jgi:hypothetical protein
MVAEKLEKITNFMHSISMWSKVFLLFIVKLHAELLAMFFAPVVFFLKTVIKLTIKRVNTMETKALKTGKFFKKQTQ